MRLHSFVAGMALAFAVASYVLRPQHPAPVQQALKERKSCIYLN